MKGHLGRHPAGLVLPVLLLLVLLSFSLPWITVSCDAAETEELTGMELVSGKEPEIYGPPDTESREDILDAVSGQQDAATLLLFVVVASLLAAFVAVVSGIPRSARVATILTVMSALGFVAFLFSSFEIFGADTHHLFGYFVATGTSVIAAIDAVWLGISTRAGSALRFPVAANVAIGGAGAIVLMLLAMYVGGGSAGYVAIALSFLVWPFSAWLTWSDPSARGAIALVISGLPLAAGGGALLSGG